VIPHAASPPSLESSVTTAPIKPQINLTVLEQIDVRAGSAAALRLAGGAPVQAVQLVAAVARNAWAPILRPRAGA